MNIVSWVYSGYFPKGIKLHLDNIRWATGGCQSFVFTTIENKAKSGVSDRVNVATVTTPTLSSKRGPFYMFWNEFANDIRVIDRIPDLFLFSELDIYFTKKITSVDPGVITASLPLCWDYLEVQENGRSVYPRIWEGGMLIPGKLIKTALKMGVSFGEEDTYYWDRQEKHYAKKGITTRLARYGGRTKDTMSDLTLFCYDQQIPYKEEIRAIHVRGPERIHGDLKELYRNPTRELIKKHQGYLGLDVLDGLAMHYIGGEEYDPREWDWSIKFSDCSWMKELDTNAAEWMQPDSLKRLHEIMDLAKA